MNYSRYLIESPQRITVSTFRFINDLTANKNSFNYIKNTKSPIDIFNGLDVWKIENLDSETEYMWFTDKDYILLILGFVDGNSYVDIKSVNQKNDCHGLARNVYKNFLLKRYDKIVSDDIMTDSGIKMYEKMLLDNELKISVYDIDSKRSRTIKNRDELYYFYDTDEKYQNFKYIIEYD